MKKVMILLLSILTTGLFAGGYSPDYGPGDQWLPTGSTQQAFIIFDGITLNGDAVDSGAQGGATGACDSGDCDILGAMFNGQCVGWSYMPVINGGVTLAIELNDGTTEATLGYPAINAAFAPTITFNLYDASEGKMYYNVASSGLQTGNALQYGSMDVTGSGDACSSNGALFGPVEDYCAAGTGCELSHYADDSAAAEFDALGTSDVACAGFSGCGSTSITAQNSLVGEAYLNPDDSFCVFGGCLDGDASNFVANGTVDLGGCTYLAPSVDCSYSYESDGTTTLTFSGEEGSSFTCDGAACDGSYSFGNTTVASGSVSVVENNGAVDAEGGSVSSATECGFEMPLPEITNLSASAGDDSCIDTDWDTSFAFAGSSVDISCGLQANTEYAATVTACNAAGCTDDSESATTNDFACSSTDSCLSIDMAISASSTFSINVDFLAGSNYAGDSVWEYEVCYAGGEDAGCTSPSDATNVNINGLSASTSYDVTVNGCSQYGCIQSETMSFMTMDPPEGEIWALDISASMAVLGAQLVHDNYNRLGFYHANPADAMSNDGTPMPVASDGFDAAWDVPEPMIPIPDNEIHFYFVNNWDEQTGWGHEWAHDIRAYRDSLYASNNTTTFNGVVIAEVGGLGTLSINPTGVTNLSMDNLNTDYYVPVYALVNGGGHNGDYYKIEGPMTIPMTLQSGVPVTVDFIVGNLVPEAADGLSSSTSSSSDATGDTWMPSSGISWDEDSSCDDVTMEGINYNDQSQGPQFGSQDYSLTSCNDFEQRYPATVYHTATSSSALSESGMEQGSRDAGTDGGHDDSESGLQFATSYTYTVSAENRAGMGASTSTSLTTVGNVDPEFTDLCENDGSNNNDCESMISSEAAGAGSGPETDEGLVTDPLDDIHLYHTYTVAHDGIGRLSPGGTDADGLDQSGTQMTITLGSAYTDHEGYLLDASWSGDIEFNTEGPAIGDSCGDGSGIYDCQMQCVSAATAESWNGDGYCDDGNWGMYLNCDELNNDGGDCDAGNRNNTGGKHHYSQLNIDLPSNRDTAPTLDFTDGNGSSVSFDVTEPNSGSGSSYTFNVAVTDNDWLTNEGNGSNTINTSVTVTILPEPNADPFADISVPGGQSDAVGGGYWQVEHNGDNEDTCDPLLAFDAQNCDDNKASVSLSHEGSGDPDCPADDPTCEEHGFWWSEAVMGMTYNDLNMNGQYDEGEPCDDATECLWSFDPNGIEPAINDGPASTDEVHEQRHTGATGNIWSLTVQDNYGAENTASRGFYVLEEPNRRSYSASASDASSDFEYGSEEDDNLVHYLDEGTSTTSITVNTGSVSDADGDNIRYETTLNGAVIDEASGDCNGSCDTGGFTRDLGPGEYTVTTCSQDSYEGYEYLMYASSANGQEHAVDMNVQPTHGHNECASFSFTVVEEPAPVDVITLDATDQGMSWITMSWTESDHTGDAQISELGTNAVHYTVQRTQTPTDVNSWSAITTLNVVREYSNSSCAGKEDIYENYSDACEDPTAGQASDDGEWYYMGQDDSDTFHFLDEGLDANSSYSYRVFAINSAGRSSNIGNVLTHSTEANPGMSFSRDMAAEIYAVDEMTNTMTASFDDANGLGGHNVSSVSSSYTTYEGTDSNGDGYAGTAGVASNGPDTVDFSYLVTAWETDHGQSITVCFEDAGDHWGYDKAESCTTTATFTGSEESLHHPYTYEGWHVFGSPLYYVESQFGGMMNSMDNLFGFGLSDYSEGSDYVWFSQEGAFGPNVLYNHGEAYFLGLNHDLVSFTMAGGVLSSADGNIDEAGHELSRGWNLVSPKLVRPVDVDMLTVTDDLGTHTWAEAQTLGIVSGEVLGTDQTSNFESSSFHPWTGFWIHVSKSCVLNVTPHADFGAAKEIDELTWNMNIEAQPIEGDARGDIIKIGLSEDASNDIKDGEDTEDIPVITMADSYLDIYMKESNGMTYWKNTKEMISPEEGQAWVINGYSANSNSDVELSWTMDELDVAYDIKMYINGDAIDMREETSVVVSSESLNNITVIVGNDPLASGLTTPAEFALTDAYPNPFNPVTSMQLALDADGFTSVKVYNLMGQVVDVIHEGMLNAGFHKVTWNAEVIPSGVYLVKVIQGEKIATQKVMLMK